MIGKLFIILLLLGGNAALFMLGNYSFEQQRQEAISLGP
jgi:hypothetical protein